jgi:oligosaccharide repeat unit polymerase
MLILPFARSEMNEIVLGDDFGQVMAVLPFIFLVTLVGYFAMLAGGSFWRLSLGLGIRSVAARTLDILPRCSLMLMSSLRLLVFQTMLCLILQAIVLGAYFVNSGFGFDLRAYTFAHPILRPIAQIASSYSVIIASHSFARYLDTKERVLLCCSLSITFGMVFFGSRGTLVAIYLGILICYLVKLGNRVSLYRMSALFIGIVVVAFYLGSARAGNFSVVEFFASIAFLLLYGNNFSDLRDFAWVYSAWDHRFWAGKTYLAAVTSFVPRFASQFRDTWGMGAATAATVGFDPHVHPGLRPGSFGEGYLNFGWLGVVVVGLLIGIISRRADLEVKASFTSSTSSMRRAAASTMMISIAGSIAVSVNVSALYTYAAIYLFSWICLLILRATQRNRFPQSIS